MSVDQGKLRSAQAAEYGQYIDYIQHTDAPLPEKETKTTMSYYSVQDGILFKSYLPGHLRKRSTFRDQLVVPKALVGLILHAYHDHVLSGGQIHRDHWPLVLTYVETHALGVRHVITAARRRTQQTTHVRYFKLGLFLPSTISSLSSYHRSSS